MTSGSDFENDLRAGWQQLREIIEDDLQRCGILIEMIEIQQQHLIHLAEAGVLDEDTQSTGYNRLEQAKEAMAEWQAECAGRIEEGDRIFMS